MKLVFIGSVEIGYTVLEAVYDAGFAVDTIFTLDFDKKEQTSGFIDFEPLANAHESALVRVKNLNEPEYIEKIKSIGPDLIIVCGWQRLVCKEILDIPRLGTIGFHSSLLPKYRGRAPVNWAIMAGEKETGITMFYLTEDADAGDIIAQKAFPIMLNDDCNTVYKKSAKAGADLIVEFLPKIANGTALTLHNPSRNYPAYPKRTPADGEIDFKRSALDVYNFIRAITKPYPGAFAYLPDGSKIVIWKAEIVFDESRLKKEDIVFDTIDMKIRAVEFCINK